jgi:chromosomal replication initiator protein
LPGGKFFSPFSLPNPRTAIADGATVLSGVFTIPQPHRAAGVPFLAGPENRLAQAASRHVLNVGVTHAAYCPLVICAPPGCGKTHLALALGEAWRKSNSDHQVHEFAAADIRKQESVATALSVSANDKNSATPASMFIVENLEQTAKQPSAQHQLRLLIDDVNSCDGRIVITSRVSPNTLDGLSPALRSRLSGGLIVALANPSFATRSAIVAAYADAARLRLSPSAVELIARQEKLTPAQLIHSIATLQQSMTTNHTDGPIEDAHVENYLASDNAPHVANVGEIAAAVAKYFRLKVADLKGRSRRRGTANARSFAMYLTWSGGGYSLKRIGQYFGGRDHSTVLHACRKVEQMIRHDAATKQTAAEITELLRGRTQT